jgi:nucleoid DNA-binding protein
MGKKVSDIAKREIVNNIVDNQGVPKAEALKIYDAVFGFVADSLKEGRSVYLTDIGRFRFQLKKARVSNLTGNVVPAHVRLQFLPNNVMKTAIKKLKKI